MCSWMSVTRGDERRFRRYITTQAPGNLKVERPNQMMAIVERKAN